MTNVAGVISIHQILKPGTLHVLTNETDKLSKVRIGQENQYFIICWGPFSAADKYTHTQSNCERTKLAKRMNKITFS